MAVLTMTASLASGVMTDHQWFSIGDGLKAFAAHYSCPAVATLHFRPHFNYITFAFSAGCADNTTWTSVTDPAGGVLAQVTVTTQNCVGQVLILGT